MPDHIDLLRELSSVGQLKYDDHSGLDAWLRRAQMVIRNVFGEKSQYLRDLNNISFSPMMYPADPQWERESWERERVRR